MARIIVAGLAVAAACTQTAFAWGNLGHQTVGYVAQAFLAPNALDFVQTSLGSTYNESLGPAATWADSVKYTPGYTWSKPLHFVDAEDSPLSGSCSVSETRDCGDGDCILSAIANYTTRIAKTSLSKAQRQEALKFLACLLQFLGDIGQPLHVEAYEVGGNDIDAVCGGKSTNLHSAWDTGILETNLDATYDGEVSNYAAALIKRIKTGTYKSLTDDWLECSSTTEPASRRRFFSHVPYTVDRDVSRFLDKRATITPLECPLVWAKESNAYCCSTVFTYSSGQDLCTGTYYNKAVPVIDLQLAKQGYRLAAWLNVIFDGDTNL
ncbi:nuclease Le1 [Epithele typhae]|uniref:nuclease Le1 n=1 Tax=Epithele typhae TaxID=378194 RepID=UPI0020080483|nr:nuclease Le1 [Epithele typhae]KAH9938793.1 nuclease Le1 [Epithele typhae]